MKYILPAIIMLILTVSVIRKNNTYDSFINGAADGLNILKIIFPALLGVITASEMLRASGAMDFLIKIVSPLTHLVGIPDDAAPIVLLRPISGSGSIGLLSDILKTNGADSFVGRVASVIMGATETTFYCISVYFAKTRVKSTAKILIIALICDFVSAVTAVWAVRLCF